MIFKPGDVLFWELHYEVVLVLELVDEELKKYKIFFLRSEYKHRVGKTLIYYVQGSCLLKDKNLNEI